MTPVDLHIDIRGMHCSSCGLLVDETLEDLDGVSRCRTDVRRGQAHLEYDPTRVTPNDIRAAIDDLGYQATPS